MNCHCPPPPAMKLHRVHLWRTVYRHLIFSRWAFSCSYCPFQEKIKPSWRKCLFEPLTEVEHNFANIKTAFDFLSTLVLRDQSKWRANKNEHGERYIMLIWMFVLKVINNERKILTRHEIIDRIAEQIVLVITRVCKESMNSSEITAVKCLIYLFI